MTSFYNIPKNANKYKITAAFLVYLRGGQATTCFSLASKFVQYQLPLTYCLFHPAIVKLCLSEVS